MYTVCWRRYRRQKVFPFQFFFVPCSSVSRMCLHGLQEPSKCSGRKERTLYTSEKQVHATHGRPTMIRFDGGSCLPYVALVVPVPARHVSVGLHRILCLRKSGGEASQLRTRISRERGRDGPILYGWCCSFEILVCKNKVDTYPPAITRQAPSSRHHICILFQVSLASSGSLLLAL